MEHLLKHPEKVTPRFLFELYTYNYQRTLFEKVLNDKTDDAIRKVKAGLCGAVKYDEERPNLGIFIELLNIFDDDFLSDKSFVETRREEWFLNPDKPIMNMPWILPETWKAEEEAFREGDRDRDRNHIPEPDEERVELCGTGLVLRELAMWSVLFNNWECLEMIRDHVKDGLEIDDKYSGPAVASVLGFDLGIALILENCLIQGEIYMTNSMSVLKGSFRELQEEIEEYTVKLVDACYSVDSELCSYLIRVENRHWGKRTALALAEKARLKKFMSTHAVQDLLDQIWTGAMEPASNFTLFVCTICPLLVPFFMKSSKNPFIDRIPWLKSGFCWSGQQYPNPVSSRQNVGTNKGYDPGFLMMIANYCTSPLFTMIVEAVFYLGFLALFAFVILQEFCIRVGFYEYILIAWMISIQAERISKFIAIPHMSKRSKIRLILRDPWNILYSFSFVCFVVGLIFRTVGVISYETIYENNVKAFKDLEIYDEEGKKIGIDLFDGGDGNWTKFKEDYKFSSISAFLSNDANPLYNETTISRAARDFVDNNYGMYPLKYISAKKDHPGIINYCPLGILTNDIFVDASFMKWAQIFYAMTFVAMSMAFLQFYNIHRRLGPLVISIMGMMVDLIMFIFILAMFLVPYGVVTTGLMHPNEHRLAATMEGVFFKPILNLYGDLIMSEYTEYEHNDDLQGCVSAEDIRAITTTNDIYGGFGYVQMTELMKNFTHEWERELKLWNECTPSHMSQLTAFYLMNYDCDFGEESGIDEITCEFHKGKNTEDEDGVIKKAGIKETVTLMDIFGECFDRVRVLKVDNDLINKTEKYETTYAYLFDDPGGPFDDFIQKIDGANSSHYDYYVFSPWEQILPEDKDDQNNATTAAPEITLDPSTENVTTAEATTDETESAQNGTDSAVLELETELDKAKNDAVKIITDKLRRNALKDIIEIFPVPSIYTFNNSYIDDGVKKEEIIPTNVGIVSERLKLNIFERRITKELDIQFNDVLPDCNAGSCFGSEAIVLGALMTYSFDKRRFNFTDQEYKSKLGNNYNFKKKNFPTLAGMKDRYIQHKDLTVDMLLLEFFHDDDKDYVAVESGDDEEEVDELDQIEELDQGMISSNGLLLFYEKKFSRCPERYWINTLFLGLYMLVANVMLVNLLVALFATTYENVQEDADQIWKLKRFDVVMEYLHKDPIPTPIASIYHILKICKYFLYSLMASKKHRTIEIVCWPRVPGDHAVSLNKFPLECYPRADERQRDNTLDGLIKQCIASQNTQVEISRQEDEVEEEPEIVIAEVQSKIERLRNSVIELANMTRLKIKVYPSVVYEAEN